MLAAMQRPDVLPDRPVLLRERWARRSIVVWVGLTVLALVVPGATALVLRPDNPGEGYLALGLATVAFAWQGYRLMVSAIEISPAGVRRLGLRSRPVPWEDIDDLHLHAIRPSYGAPRPPLHHLRMSTAAGTIRLTRYPMREPEAVELARALDDLGICLPDPNP